MIKWFVQNNFRIDSDDSVIIKNACEKYGFSYNGVKVIPFSDVTLDKPDNLTVFYGGTGWINKIYNQYPDTPGIFFNPESTFPYWNNKYKENSLNYKALVTTFEDIVKEKFPDDERFFIRPISDLKEFSGGVMKFGDIKDWSEKIFTDVPDLGKLPIVVGEPFGLGYEWRLFIIEGKVCTASQYRTYYVRNTKPGAPDDVIEFAEEQAKIFSPSPIFVMDVCKSGKHLYIIEIGCINSAGFYDCDIEKIVNDVSNYLISYQ
jgi:hypothetical protein